MADEEKKQEGQDPVEDRFSRLIKDVKKGLKDIGSTAVEKAEEFGKIASEKAEELTKTGKIRLDVMQLKRNRNKVLSELGSEVFDLHTAKKLKDLEKSDTFKASIDQIKSLDVEISDKEAEIERIQEEEANEPEEEAKS